MKRIIITATACLLLAIPGGAQNHEIDFFQLNILSVATENNDGTKKHTKKEVSYDSFSLIGLGWTGSLNEDPGLSLNPRFCSDIFTDVISVQYRPGLGIFSFKSGIRLGYHSLRVTGDEKFTKVDNSVLLTPFPENSYRHMSALRYWSLSLPALVSLKSRRFGVYAGVEGNFNMNAHIKDKYRVDGSSRKFKTRDVNVKSFNYDLVFGVDFHDIGVYFKYTPDKGLIKSGPQFNMFSVGILLQ